MTSELPPLPSRDQVAGHSLFTLPDGRHLAYMEWGDPNGFPTFYFHGTPSSRLEGAFAHAAAQKHRLRLIATDRPGYGYSSFQHNRAFRNWPEDICQLADELGVEAFGVAGHSGAGPHLFACGACIDPARLRFIGALGPWGPVASPEIMADLNALDRFYARMSRRVPWIMRTAFAPLGWGARYWPKLFFKVMEANVSEADKARLRDKTFLHHFREMEQEAFRQGSRGAAHEAAICFGVWDFDIAEVAVPTYIWLGEDDIFVSNKMGYHLKDKIPGAELHLLPDKGHFNIENWNDVFRACVKHVS